MSLDIKVIYVHDLKNWVADCQKLNVTAKGVSAVEALQNLAKEISIVTLHDFSSFLEQIRTDTAVYSFIEENPDILRLALIGITKLYEFFGNNVKELRADIFEDNGKELYIIAIIKNLEDSKALDILEEFDDKWWNFSSVDVCGKLTFDIEF